jgi:hypothetical protein
MEKAHLLRFCYAANIFILVPVCWSMFSPGGVSRIFGAHVPESAGLRLMIASLWTAILLLSAYGLWKPAAVSPIILVQILYKSLWLICFVLPLILDGKGDTVPTGISLTFLMIVITYPLIYASAR